MAVDKNAQAVQHLLPGLQAPKLRDMRANTQIHVHYAPGADDDASDREVQLYVTLNLLPRMFSKVSLSGAKAADVFPRHPSHAKRIKEETEIPPDAQYVIVLSSTPIPAGDAKTIYVDSRGWLAINSIDGPSAGPPRSPNAAAATYAAALAVGNLLNFLLAPYHSRIQVLSGEHSFNLATLREGDEAQPVEGPRRVVLEDLGIIGVGAVGQALCYVLSRFDLAGNICIVDHDAIDESNESRYLLAFPEVRGKFKTGVVAEEFRRSQNLALRVHENIPTPFGLEVQTLMQPIPPRGPSPLVAQVGRYGGFPADYEKFQAVARNGRPFQVAVATVDTAAARRDILAGLHKVVYNGWTDTRETEMEYGIGRHTINGPDECLACAYHHTEDKEPDEVEFLSRLTGWRRELVRRHLVQQQPLTDTEVMQLAERLQLEAGEHRGKTLRQLVHIMCGQGIQVLGGRFEVAPLFHVPTLVGALLAAQIVLEASGGQPVRNHAVYAATTLPTSSSTFFQTKKAGCICGDEDVQRVFESLWSTGTPDAATGGSRTTSPD